jgi:hypothetical protein
MLLLPYLATTNDVEMLKEGHTWISKMYPKIVLKWNLKYMLDMVVTKFRREIRWGILFIIYNLITVKSVLIL